MSDRGSLRGLGWGRCGPSKGRIHLKGSNGRGQGGRRERAAGHFPLGNLARSARATWVPRVRPAWASKAKLTPPQTRLLAAPVAAAAKLEKVRPGTEAEPKFSVKGTLAPNAVESTS